ncbi:MAG: hypothetical protein RLZ12_783 [Bacillota bacterium]|jgi:hypothetical protein
MSKKLVLKLFLGTLASGGCLGGLTTLSRATDDPGTAPHTTSRPCTPEQQPSAATPFSTPLHGTSATSPSFLDSPPRLGPDDTFSFSGFFSGSFSPSDLFSSPTPTTNPLSVVEDLANQHQLTATQVTKVAEDLDARYNQGSRVVEGLRAKVAQLGVDNGNLKTANAALAQRTASLETKVADLQQQLELLTEAVKISTETHYQFLATIASKVYTPPATPPQPALNEILTRLLLNQAAQQNPLFFPGHAQQTMQQATPMTPAQPAPLIGEIVARLQIQNQLHQAQHHQQLPLFPHQTIPTQQTSQLPASNGIVSPSTRLPVPPAPNWGLSQPIHGQVSPQATTVPGNYPRNYAPTTLGTGPSQMSGGPIMPRAAITPSAFVPHQTTGPVAQSTNQDSRQHNPKVSKTSQAILGRST